MDMKIGSKIKNGVYKTPFFSTISKHNKNF